MGRGLVVAIVVVWLGCGGSTEAVGPNPGGGSPSAGVQCSYAYSGTNASLGLTSTVAWSCSQTARSLTGNGVPDHDTGTFPNRNNPNAIQAVNVSASMPLSPTPAAATVSQDLHVVGYALNSVKFDPSTAGTCTVANGTTSCTLDCNRNGTCGQASTWNIEALGQSSFNFGVDSSNAHVQPNGAYHYHGMPEGFLSRLGKGQAMTLVGFAMDGYPVYARYGYSTATDAKSALRVLRSSWQLKAAADAGRPPTSTYAMGAFTQDYQYVAGSGDLDECNGRTGVTPEFPEGTYAYYVTETWPFIGRCLKGAYIPPAGRP